MNIEQQACSLPVSMNTRVLHFWSNVVLAVENTFHSSDQGQLRVWRRDNTRYVFTQAYYFLCWFTMLLKSTIPHKLYFVDCITVATKCCLQFYHLTYRIILPDNFFLRMTRETYMTRQEAVISPGTFLDGYPWKAWVTYKS